MVHRAGVKLPAMYGLGYEHNNCIGCVKGGMGYWNKIRKDFPDAFEKMAKAAGTIMVPAVFASFSNAILWNRNSI